MFEHSLSEFAYLANRIVLALLVLLSVVNLALFFERKWFFRHNFLREPELLLNQLSDCKTHTEVNQILERTGSAEARLVLRALVAQKTRGHDFRRAAEGFAASESVGWERSVALFAWSSSSGPLLGLLGTILGLMKAFSDLAMAEIPDPQIALAGVSDALLTTVFGIIVAMPATAFYNYCKRRTRKASATVESLILLILSRGSSQLETEAGAAGARPKLDEAGWPRDSQLRSRADSH